MGLKNATQRKVKMTIAKNMELKTQVILNNHCAFYAVVARSLHISTCHFGHRQVSEFGRAGELLVTTLKQAASTGRQVSSAQTK